MNRNLIALFESSKPHVSVGGRLRRHVPRGAEAWDADAAWVS